MLLFVNNESYLFKWMDVIGLLAIEWFICTKSWPILLEKSFENWTISITKETNDKNQHT